uniref:LAGLIDADG homing endonuclease n=1 Tax=Phanerochaete carnosa TaxID=231932 RepID=A0A895KWE5_9APHY|nr:LAGLIDADG homing endonuclease [Phanerochaete carnosa]QRZ60382.1 LAGLIDADG homing endonuclease [Phanerochaete carnosa]
MSNVSDSEYMSTEAQTKLVENSNQINSCVEAIQKLINNSGNKNFISWLNQYYDFLNSLSLHQESSFVNILLFLILMFSVFNFLAIFFGNEIIKYFNLENKFPSLATFFKLRTKFKKYYLLWSIFVLFVVCSVGICINLLILL